MALLAPLAFWTLRRRLGSGRLGAATGALAVSLVPGVTAFSWFATENGLEAVAGMAGLLLATSKRRGWWLAPVLAALSISLYGSGLAWALAIGLVLVWRILRDGAHSRTEVAPVIAASVLAVGVLVFPLYWWRGGKIIAGGGEPSLSGAPVALGHLSTELLRSGDSYYYFTDQPALGAWPLALLAGGGLVW